MKYNFSNPFMYYDVYYPSGCDVELGEHYCSNCPTPEHARVRSVAFIKSGFEFTDPTSPTEWQTGIANKDIIIIPETNGSFDGGAEVEGPGYGDQATKLVGYNFSLTYNDPNYKENANFYNTLKRVNNYRVAYRTESQVHISNNTVSAIPKNPVAEDLTAEVTWNVQVKWADDDLPIPYDVPEGIFTCFDYL
jgi:hypothetical protein